MASPDSRDAAMRGWRDGNYPLALLPHSYQLKPMNQFSELRSNEREASLRSESRHVAHTTAKTTKHIFESTLSGL